MNNKRYTRWIQLSDLHMFEESSDLEIYKEELYDMFDKKVDFIVITGDLHQYGRSYKFTLDFLNELVERIGIEKRDVVIIPGNHDAKMTDKRKNAIEIIDNALESNQDVYADKKRKLCSGFTAYKKFIREFYGEFYNELYKNGDPLSSYIYNWKNKISILCMNTALISSEEHYKPQIVDIAKLGKLENTGLPCLALMHHDYYSISDMHKININKCFKKLGVSAVLSGHKHRLYKSHIDVDNNIKIPIYGCGKSTNQSGDIWSDIGIIEYRWEQTNDKVQVIPYKFNNVKNLVPTFEFEDKNINVDDERNIEFENEFSWIDNSNRIVELSKCDICDNDDRVDLEKFYEKIQFKYLDGIINKIKGDEDKYNRAINIMEKIVTYQYEEFNFNNMVDNIVKCGNKVVLSVNGLQGTGKSTFMSLLFYSIRKKYNNDEIIPILIDLHYFDKYAVGYAKTLLLNDLNEIDNIVKRYSDRKVILLFDGLDDYFRKTSNLENIIYGYIEKIKNQLKSFALCIGSADYLPDSVNSTSKLRKYSQLAMYELEMNRLNKSNDEKITSIIKDLIKIYDFSLIQNDIELIKKIICEYTINKVDFRTCLIILRALENNKKQNNDYQSKGYFYDYYLIQMDGSEKELFENAKAVYEYLILRNKKILRHKKNTQIMHNNGITADFLLAYYFVRTIKEGEKNPELNTILKADFVFTVSVNKFIKNLILYKYKNEQKDMVEKLKVAYENSNMSMKSQISYILGRIQENNAKDIAKKFLCKQWEKMYKKLFANDKIKEKKIDIKEELVLFRSIAISLIWLGYNNNTECFLRCILLNEKLNQINRGFHLEYYEEKKYINGESPTYIDDNSISVNKTMDYLINNINKGFSANRGFNKAIYLDIVTLYSIYQYRMKNKDIIEKYGEKLSKLAEKILASTEIQSITVRNYISGIKDNLTGNMYKAVMENMYKFKNIQREGWVRRKVNNPESIADHMYGCCIFASLFLPDNVYQCIDYEIPDIEDYSKYSKDTIIKMLLIHDLGETRVGDIVTAEKSQKDIDEEDCFFKDNEFLCSFPYIYGLGNTKKMWDEFKGNSSINAKIANDIDKIEPLIQAYIYEKEGNNIGIKEWKNDLLNKVNTTLGKKILQLLIEEIVE